MILYVVWNVVLVKMFLWLVNHSIVKDSKQQVICCVYQYAYWFTVARMDVAIAFSGDSSVLSLLEEEINTTYSTTGPYLFHSVLDFDIFFDFL